MKKVSLLLIAVLLVFNFNPLSAQTLTQPDVAKHYFKPLNGNPLDAIRQRNSAYRMVNTAITVDYATSNGDDFALASNINMHYSLPTDSFTERYVVVAWDSLHNSINNTGYKYSDFDSVRIDSVFFAIGHENNDGLSDTMIVKVIQLNANGYPTNAILWSQTFTSGPTSFTGQNDWLQFGAFFVAPNLKVPSTTHFGFRVEYYGAKADTFGYLFSFVDSGSCANYGTSYSAKLSNFWPNSYRFDVTNNMVLPTAGNLDYKWDCDGNGTGENAFPTQNIDYIAKLTGIRAGTPTPKIRLVRVNPTNEEVTIKNFGTAAQNISTYILCSKFAYTANLSSQQLLAGSLNLNAGDTVKIKATSINLDENNGADLGLYINNSFTNPASMVDFTQWMSGGNGRESVAVSKGIWGAGQFVSNNSPYRYIGNGFQDGVAYWQGQAPQQPGGCDTLANVFIGDTLSLYGASGGGYVSGHNSFGDIAKVDSFGNATTGQVTGVFLLFGDAEYADTNAAITVAVWNNNGTGGSPGTILASESLKISHIDNTGNFTYVAFSPAASVTGSFYVGIKFTYASGDTVALITNQIGNGHPNTAWEQWNDNTWHSFHNAWGFDLNHYILPVLCTSGSCPTITVNTSFTNSICTSVNGTATATASGGTGPYAYSWSGNRTGATINGLAAGNYTVTATDANSCTGTGSVTVGNTTTALTVNVTKTNNTSCGTPNGSATATASAGTAPYTYAWSNAGNATTISGLAAATYSVTVYDANGCSGTGSTTVTNAQPVLTVATTSTTPNSQCIGHNGAATVAASGGTGPYTYLWNAAANNHTGATASNLAGGVYSVTATDAGGCTGTASVTVGTTTPTITISTNSTTQNTSCSSPNGSATVSASGGAGFYTYSWSNGAIGATASNILGGNYTVTATDANGCTGSGSVTVSSTTPVITVSVTNSTGNNSCINPNGSATVSASGGTGPYAYSWSSGQSVASISGAQNGSYMVSATDVNSCVGTNSVTIADNKPVLSVTVATSPVTSCVTNNGSATATTTGAAGTVTYTWSTSPAQTSPTASNLAAGNYTVTAVDQTSGCSATGSGTIGTNTPAVSVTISSTNNVTNCANPNGSATATASGGAGGFNYIWSTSPQQTGATATNLAAGNYTVTVTSSNGCTASAPASISDNTATVIADITVTAVTSCTNPNGTAIAVANGGSTPYSYSWSGGQTSSTLNGLSAGVYSVTITDANGCEGSDNSTVGTNINSPSVSATATNETNASANNGTATATGSGGSSPYSYSWSNGGSSATISGLDAGTYTVTLSDASGCTASASATVQTGTGVSMPDGLNTLSIYPNPAKDVVNVNMDLKGASNVKVEWFNVLGEKVIMRELSGVKSVEEKFNMGLLPEGVYMTRITVDGNSVTRRITVVK